MLEIKIFRFLAAIFLTIHCVTSCCNKISQYPVWFVQVLFDGKQAVGVEFLREGKAHKTHSRREVILSAGAVGSPHILMLSGIGPKQELVKYKVNTEIKEKTVLYQ